MVVMLCVVADMMIIFKFMIKTKQYPREFERAPNWPVEMYCKTCGFKGWQWLGMTKMLCLTLTKGKKWSKCNGCGAGIIEMTDEKLPVFILKN